MAGYSITQASALIGTPTCYLRRHAPAIRGASKDGDEWRLPLDGLAEFVISNKKLMAGFRENMENATYPFRYQESGKILEEKINQMISEDLEKPIEILTTKQIVSLPMGDVFPYLRTLTELCKTRRIVAFKNRNSRFTPWQIPTESFAIFLVFNTDAFNAFTTMCQEWLPYWKEKDSEMYKIANSIKRHLNKVPFMFDEAYTAQDLSNIFDIPLNEVISTFFAKTPFQKIRAKIAGTAKSESVSWRIVAEYMHLNREKVTYLYDKWTKLSREGSDKEAAVRHLLMLYEYYTQIKKDANIRNFYT